MHNLLCRYSGKGIHLDLPGCLSGMLKSSSDNGRIEEKLYLNISVQVVGLMTEGDLPNPNTVQTLLCSFYKGPYTCGMIHERQSAAHVQPSKPLYLQGRFRLRKDIAWCNI